MKIRMTIAAAVLVLFGAGEAVAQMPGIEIKVNPRIGLYAPLTDLAEETAGATTVTSEMSGSLALGLGVELDMVALPVNVRANLDYATGSEVTVSTDGATQGEGTETNLLAVAGDLIFRPLPSIVVAQPYLFAGGGLKRYDVDVESLPAGSTLDDENDFTVHLGGGLDVGLGPLALNAEVGDYISWFEAEGAEDSEMQHDLFVTIGFVIGLL